MSNMQTQILKLNKAGTPQAWIDIETAATVKAKGQVLWEMGSLAKSRKKTCRVYLIRCCFRVTVACACTAVRNSGRVICHVIMSFLVPKVETTVGRTVLPAAVAVIISKVTEHPKKRVWNCWRYHLHRTCMSIFILRTGMCCRIRWIF